MENQVLVEKSGVENIYIFRNFQFFKKKKMRREEIRGKKDQWLGNEKIDYWNLNYFEIDFNFVFLS